MSWRNQIDPSCLVFSKKIANLPACNIFNVRTEFKLHLKKWTVADQNMAAQTPMVWKLPFSTKRSMMSSGSVIFKHAQIMYVCLYVSILDPIISRLFLIVWIPIFAGELPIVLRQNVRDVCYRHTLGPTSVSASVANAVFSSYDGHWFTILQGTFEND